MKINMEDLKNLVKKLLDRKPVEAEVDGYFGPNITYKDEKNFYKIDMSINGKSQYSLNLFIGQNDLDLDGHDFNCKITEREYMEFKWKIEEWKNELHADAFSEFSDFVKQQEDPMNTLLND